MKGTKIWYFNALDGKKGVFNNARVAERETGISYDTLQKKLKLNGEYTWKGWIFARREIEK